MRASLKHHLWNAVRHGRLGRLTRIGLRALAARHEVRLPGALRGPLLATFAITYRCPLACEMCDLPRRARNEIPDSDIPRWIDALADLGPAGLGFTGGEPLLRKVVFSAIERAAGHGMVTHLNTSGIALTEDGASRLAGSGLASVNVSIDGADAAVHDRVRHKAGSHAAALETVRLLDAARVRLRSPLRIQVMMAVSQANLAAVPELSRQAREHGADALSVIPVHDPAGAGDMASACGNGDATAYLRAESLENSGPYLSGIVPFLRGEQTPGRCTAPTSAVFIDPTGSVFACTPSATWHGTGIEATPDSLGKIVRSGRLADTVPEGLCQRCWWNCHRELDIAIGRR